MIAVCEDHPLVTFRMRGQTHRMERHAVIALNCVITAFCGLQELRVLSLLRLVRTDGIARQLVAGMAQVECFPEDVVGGSGIGCRPDRRSCADGLQDRMIVLLLISAHVLANLR